MGTQAYRANLSSAIFPLTIADGGRTVIIPGPDQNFDRRVDPTGAQKDAGIPQALYMENCIPTVNGFQSVGYKSIGTLPSRFGAGVGQPSVFENLSFSFITATSGKTLEVMFREGPGGYYDTIASGFSPFGVTWTQGTGSNPTNGAGSGVVAGLSKAVVRNENYLFDGSLLYLVTNPGTDVVNFADITGTLTGIVASDIRWIFGSFNYLIAITEDNRFNWSSTTTATDFVSSLVTGAGSIDINGLTGKIQFVRETPTGCYIYTTNEVVNCQYTGNARYPFKFTPISDVEGFVFPYQVTSSGINSAHYGISTNGKIYLIQAPRAQVIAPEVTTFIERTTSADAYNTSTNVFSRAALVFSRKIHCYLDKYIFLEYTVGGEKYFLFNDLATQRYGKLKQEGRLVSSVPQSATQADVRIYCIRDFTEGESYQLGWDTEDSTYTHSGVLLLGKFQYVRSRFMNLTEIELEGPAETSGTFSSQFSLAHLPSLDGRNFDSPSTPYNSYSSGGVKKYNIDTQRMSAQNHSLAIKGRFNLSTVQLRFFAGGER